MSKANTWLETIRSFKPLDFRCRVSFQNDKSNHVVAWIEDNPNSKEPILAIGNTESHILLNPIEAIKLADWIHDTFGEEKA